MKKWLLLATLLFGLFIVAIVVLTDTDRFPNVIERIYDFPGGDKAGHFILFGVLAYLLDRSILQLLPKRKPARLILAVSLLLAILIALEEWSQSLFPARTISLIDLIASYAGVFVFGLFAYKTRN